MSSYTIDINCSYYTELVFVTVGILCVNAILIVCVAVSFSYKSIKYIQTQELLNQPVCKTTRYYIVFCTFTMIVIVCSHISLVWANVNCLIHNEKLISITWIVYGITMLMSGYCCASIFVIRLQLVFENTVFATKKSILYLLYFGLAVMVIIGIFACILFNFYQIIALCLGTIPFGLYIFFCAVIIKLFIQGLVNVVRFGLNGKQAATHAEKEVLLMNMHPHIKALIEMMSKFSILVLVCFISTLINLITFGLRNLFVAVFDGTNPAVIVLLSQITFIIYSIDLVINSICLTLQFHYFYNDIYDQYCFKLHNSCKNMVINHVFNNNQNDQKSPNATVSVV